MTQVRSLESRVPEISKDASAASACCDSGKFSRDSRAACGERVGVRGTLHRLRLVDSPPHPALRADLSPQAGRGDPRTCFRGSSAGKPLSLHRTFIVEAVLAVLDDGGDGFQRERAVGVLDNVLQVEFLDG